MPKLCHNTPLSIFSLGKGRESLYLKTLHKKLSKSALSALPQACKKLRFGQCVAKIAQNKFTFPQILHLSSNRRVCNLAFYFQFTTPARKLTHRMKFEHVWITRILGMPRFFHTLGQRNAKNQTQKDTNFTQNCTH